LKLFNISYTALFNPLYVAITAVPLGLSRSGLPIGVQIVASPLNDRLSIAAAEELEKAFGGWVSPTDINCKN
jgi:fatty acid amide hydrolase 2